MKLAFVLLSGLHLCYAVPAAEVFGVPTVTIRHPPATIIGLAGTVTQPAVEQFPGIPFAKPPVGPLRLKPPQALTKPQGTILALKNGNACPQMVFSTVLNDAIPTSELGLLLNTPLFQKALGEGEDCLVLNVHRPTGTRPGDKLPVLFWIFGGAFELGWNSMYDGSIWVSESMKQRQPIIMVTVNYRVGGFGFLPGKEILADGSANLGLLDQRLGLEWVADNIAAFGGDPDKVTIWGESAGAISVFDQLALYNGNHTYKGKPLFRGAMMNSGSVIPADPVDAPQAQAVYDMVVREAGCAWSDDSLECLRRLPYEKLLFAMNSPPSVLSYSSVSLSYLPRPDGKVLTQSPDQLGISGKFAKVPFILGDQEDEGTLFALFQSNITTVNQLEDYLLKKFFSHATKDQMRTLVGLYSDILANGSPFRTGLAPNWYPQFKRLAAILGDLTFTISRRAALFIASGIYPDNPTWSYLSSYDYGTPILGTTHGSDLLQVFFGIRPDYASAAFHAYYINFVNNLDPNKGGGKFLGLKDWPTWKSSNKVMNMYPDTSTLITDDFRTPVFNFVLENLNSLYI
jgi:carboxylesterase type B